MTTKLNVHAIQQPGQLNLEKNLYLCKWSFIWLSHFKDKSKIYGPRNKLSFHDCFNDRHLLSTETQLGLFWRDYVLYFLIMYDIDCTKSFDWTSWEINKFPCSCQRRIKIIHEFNNMMYLQLR